jgi:hypothetical protein
VIQKYFLTPSGTDFFPSGEMTWMKRASKAKAETIA